MTKTFTVLKDGNAFYEKIESIDDARKLANNMSNSGHYPAGLSPCFTAGINGDWEDDRVCPISKIDYNECTCDEEFKQKN